MPSSPDSIQELGGMTHTSAFAVGPHRGSSAGICLRLHPYFASLPFLSTSRHPWEHDLHKSLPHES